MNIPQNLKDACRWICFETDVDGWEVATDGGTLFLVTYGGRPYGLTAKHNLHSFAWGDLIVTKTRLSNYTAGLKSVHYVGTGIGHAVGSDLLDVAIVQFSNDVAPEFFEGSTYNLDVSPVCESSLDDDLIMYGALTTPSMIYDKQIIPTFAELGFIDVGPSGHDPVLRKAKGQWLNSRVHDVNGLSGGPVYNVTHGGLCGMTLRGGVAADSGIATSHYIDIVDIARVLHSVHEDQSSGSYVKIVALSKQD